jgi:ferritin-like protein
VSDAAGFHEPLELLDQITMERHRATRSVIEELDAVDWYDQRARATKDDALRAVLEHNRDEEREHAAMALEWLRRNDEVWNRVLRTYLFTTGALTEVEARAEGEVPSVNGAEPGLGIGNLRDPGA